MSDVDLISAGAQTVRRGRFDLLLLLCVAGAARLLWLAILPSESVSLDLHTWIWVANDLIHHINPYASPPWMNHPPFWTEIIFLLERFSTAHGMDFLLEVRLVLIFGDLALLAATYLLLRTLQPRARHMRLLLIGYCLNPLLILLTVQHGNFDAISMIGVVLFLYFLVRFRNSSDPVDWLSSALCLGIAVYVKQFPFLLWPLLVPGARRLDWRARVVGPVLFLAPAALSLAPLYVLSPDAVFQNVLDYRSFGTTFGVVGILDLAGFEKALPIYSHLFTAIALGGSVAVAIGLWRRNWRRDGDPVLYSAMLLLSLFTLGPGYGSQYWFWVVPLVLVCYPNFGAGFRRAIWISLSVVVATAIFEYAVEANLGRFLFYFSPSSSLQSLSDYFTYPSTHLIWLRVPMTLAAFLLILCGARNLIWRYAEPPEIA